MKTLILAPVALAFGLSAALAAPVKVVRTDKGEVLAGENGMTLYTFRNDRPGESTCYDTCAVNWPPLLAVAGEEEAEGGYSVITRTDGLKQWTRDGMPLYYWARDTKEGDTTGDGVNGVWDVARP